MKTYLVGGAVRDRLLGLEPRERDWVVVGATPEEMKARGFRQVGKDFPVFLHPQTGEEYALARTERKTAPGYHGFDVHASPEVTLEEDLRRRDLTINAMAMDEEGRLIDPFGGARDLREGILRHVSPAFAEDPVRILRVARFAARFSRWGFRVAHSTNALMRSMVEAGEVDALVPERVWAETEKALGEEHPERYFEVLRGCGALARIFPEIDALYGGSGNAHGAGRDATHALRTLQEAARLTPDTRVRFAALVHDLGAAGAPPGESADAPERIHRSSRRIESLCRRLRVPRAYRELALLAARCVPRCHRVPDLDPGAVLDLLEDADAFRRPERFEQLLLVCKADWRALQADPAAAYPQGEFLRRARESCMEVEPRRLLAEGFRGRALARELRARRGP